MSFTGQHLVDLARETLNDAIKTRYTDVSLILFANAGLGALCLLRPDLFVVTAALATVTATAEQDIATADAAAIKLYWVYRVVGGNVIQPVDLDALNSFSPGWMVADVDDPVEWARHPEDPKQESGTKYYLNPPPKAGVQVLAKYVKAPLRTVITLAAVVPVPDAYMDPLAHYILFRAESKDDEHVIEQRATQAMQFFLQSIGKARDAKVFMNDGKPQ